MGKYFIEDDFKAFREEVASSRDEKVISERQRVKDKFKALHEGGLKDFMRENDLYPHPCMQHLINNIYPVAINDNYVDFIRISYGKSEEELKALKENITFRHTTQLELCLDEEGWVMDLYLGTKGWIEQRNLVNKLQGEKERKIFADLISDVINNGFLPCIYRGEDIKAYETSNEFIEDLCNLTKKRIGYSINIRKEKDINDKENDNDRILGYIIKSFSQLMDTYKFISWHPVLNNYLE